MAKECYLLNYSSLALGKWLPCAIWVCGVLCLLTSCLPAYVPEIPFSNEVPSIETLPIDGSWVNEHNLAVRLEMGKMYIDDPTVKSPMRNGMVIAKNIRQISPLKYTCESSIYNSSLRVAGFGPGEIEVISEKQIVFRTFPNIDMMIKKEIAVTFDKIGLNDEGRFLSQFSYKTITPNNLKPSQTLKADSIHKDSKGPASMPSALESSPIAKKWAVIIGISNYKDTRIPSLRYAAMDAKAFYDWIISAEGGKYSPVDVKLLLNHYATVENMKDALFEWLGQALAEDMVTIYFAGHGSPQSPDHPNNLFLLPYDADYTRITTTCFPMWDIETALKRFIKSKKVVVIADACHSGGVGAGFDVARRANRGILVNPISSGIQNLSQIGDGVCVVSASDDKQLSQESKDWGGGHGVFTYYLLKGLNGEADYNEDNRVTLGEIIPFLSEQVRRATSNTQSPTVAGKFDPALTIGK
ncbi:MAG: caspase family protein [Desulfobacterales bacterium]|nr:caspase family protein [Desulfobacterales bacterium]